MIAIIVGISLLALSTVVSLIRLREGVKPGYSKQITLFLILQLLPLLFLIGFEVGNVLGQSRVVIDKESYYVMKVELKPTRDYRGLRVIRPDTSYIFTWREQPLKVPIASPRAYVLDSDTLWTTATFEYKPNR